jgi:hypothetical protein
MSKRSPRGLLKIALIVFVFVGLATYGLFQARNFIAGPTLTILEPRDGTSFSSSSPQILVSGEAKNISYLTLNGLQIFTDSKGKFSRQVALLPGLNVVSLEAKDKFNKVVKKSLQLIYQ